MVDEKPTVTPHEKLPANKTITSVEAVRSERQDLKRARDRGRGMGCKERKAEDELASPNGSLT